MSRQDVLRARTLAIAKLWLARREWPTGSMSHSAWYDLVVETGAWAPSRVIVTDKLPRTPSKCVTLYVASDERVYWIPEETVATAETLEEYGKW